MKALPEVYRTSWGLLTDLYQLTMAYGYWKQGIAEREAVFHVTFRKAPFGGEFAVACGLSHVVEFLREFRFSADDLEYLKSLRGADERPLFELAFLNYLSELRFACDVDAMPEGTVAFAHEPLLRVTGPILQAQIIETALLNMINFQTLIATKAARICSAAQGEPVLEFGLRRAQGIDGGLTASRAAYIGGCAATSNVLAGKLFDIPVKGTHAHSWIMAFDDERAAFRAYAEVLPNNCVFLVDTFDTLQGVQHAVEVATELRETGHEMLGVRLDSGDLAELSKQTRAILDRAGFPDAAIVASNDLDEATISELKSQGATINVWGVGTRLATAYDQPALGGVYKLSAIRMSDQWEHRIKLSEEPIKVSTPGKLQVRRYRERGQFAADMIFDELRPPPEHPRITLYDGSRTWRPRGEHEDLLVSVFRDGQPVYQPPSIHETRARTAQQLAQLNECITRLSHPQPYRVGLEAGLYQLKQEMTSEARRKLDEAD